MTADPTDSPSRDAPAPGLLSRQGLGRAWRFLKGTAAFLFVCWNLFFLAFRNPLDLWWDDVEAWFEARPWWGSVGPWFKPADRATTRYGHVTGTEQGWSMFTPRVARAAPYLAAQLEFDDGTGDTVFSTNEFEHDKAYVRVGGWRQRRLEDKLANIDGPEKLAEYRAWGNPDLALWESYARHAARRWRAAHPDDRRRIVTIKLICRSTRFPEPGQDPKHFEQRGPWPVGEFDPDGRLR
jgi:hypothetical protein